MSRMKEHRDASRLEEMVSDGRMCLDCDHEFPDAKGEPRMCNACALPWPKAAMRGCSMFYRPSPSAEPQP